MNKTGFVATRSSANKECITDNYENVTFTRHKKPVKSMETARQVHVAHIPPHQHQGLDQTVLKKLRFEVIKLAASGMNATEKEQTQIALAVALGAKPPKKRNENYKEILNKKNKMNNSLSNVPQQPKKHFYVVGDNVIPAKSKDRKEGVRNFLGNYGKAKIRKQSKGPTKRNNYRSST